ncbi:MAG: YggS family pyridoxal phosphate-dependent enzyme [Oscillospiraceae bacterium]|jgi:pyridoxal phosphate enzyme (YggS family)|nr:YggS family pyridoxal phosphate-dependent enzyme [Oscillospiraceae bacterium]
MNTAANITENIRLVREAIDKAARVSGRLGSDITLVAAAKTNDTASVRAAIAAGVDAVGENRVQELVQKKSEGAYIGAPLHFIGHLQTNKLKSVVGECDLIESVGSETLLVKIAERARVLGITQDVLIEVNVGGEESKSGISAQDIGRICDVAAANIGVRVLGLMAIPPIIGENREKYHYFTDMFKLFVDISEKKYDNVIMQHLSMGMSDSYMDAIAAGATMVRVGSAIFGARPKVI